MIKFTCEKCHRFCGLIKDDGTGPILDNCQEDAFMDKCPALEQLRDYQPKRIPLGLAGGRGGGLDEPSGYQANAIRQLEGD